MTLPDPEMMQTLKDEFVVGWKNIEKASHVGSSLGYWRNQTAVGTTNGAGGRNVQLVVLSPDMVVLHVMPGFWHPDDMLAELRFAKQLHRLWLDDSKSDFEKRKLFSVMHQAFAARLSADTIARSSWQGFDAAAEFARLSAGEQRDTFQPIPTGSATDPASRRVLKPTCQLLHDRMALQPFRYLNEFDMEAYTDYGRPFYDLNAGLDKGKPFPAADKAVMKREAEKARAARAAEKAAKSKKVSND